MIEEGSEEFKGRYIYKTTLIETSYEQNCKYRKKNETVVNKFKRFCQGSLKDKPYWLDVDLEDCGTKHKLTEDLIELEQVRQ